MARAPSIRLALDLAAMPVLAGMMQRQPLPPDVLDVIKIAADCPETSLRAQTLTGEKPEIIRQAAILYLQNVLFTPSADSYRVLGVGSDAPHDEIRQHMRWLMKWLHPDRQRSDWESAFAERVLSAWDALKSPERREAHDRAFKQKREFVGSTGNGPRHRRPRIPWISGPLPLKTAAKSVSARLLPVIGIGVATLTLLMVLAWPFFSALPSGQGYLISPDASAQVEIVPVGVDNSSVPAVGER